MRMQLPDCLAPSILTLSSSPPGESGSPLEPRLSAMPRSLARWAGFSFACGSGGGASVSAGAEADGSCTGPAGGATWAAEALARVSLAQGLLSGCCAVAWELLLAPRLRFDAGAATLPAWLWRERFCVCCSREFAGLLVVEGSSLRLRARVSILNRLESPRGGSPHD
jgi:hypothetical protein